MGVKKPLPQGSKLYKEIGQIYGQLRVVDIYKDEKEQIKCECVCRCGGVSEVYISNLKAGRTKSCGCLEEANRRKFLDLSGRVFDDLRVVKKTELRKDNCVVWQCICEKCGDVSYRIAKDLKRGYRTHCKCTPVKRKTATFRDLSNQKFHRLTAQYPTSERNKKGSVMWHCRCSCGNEIDVSEDELVHGSRYSCGCRKIEVEKEFGKRKQLIDGTCIESLNRKIRRDNSTGCTGVFKKKNGKYGVILGFKGKKYNLGDFEALEDAVMVREKGHQLVHIGFINAYQEWKKRGDESQTWAKLHPFIFEVTQNPDRTLSVINSMTEFQN